MLHLNQSILIRIYTKLSKIVWDISQMFFQSIYVYKLLYSIFSTTPPWPVQPNDRDYKTRKGSKSRSRWSDGTVLCFQHFVLSFETSNGRQRSDQLVTRLSKKGLAQQLASNWNPKTRGSVQFFTQRFGLGTPVRWGDVNTGQGRETNSYKQIKIESLSLRAVFRRARRVQPSELNF